MKNLGLLFLVLISFTCTSFAGDRVFSGEDEHGAPCKIVLRYFSNKLFGFHVDGTANYSVPAQKDHLIRINHQFDGNPMRMDKLGISPLGSFEAGKITFRGGPLEVVFDIAKKTVEATERNSVAGVSFESKRLKCLNVVEGERNERPSSATTEVSTVQPAGRK